MAPPKENITILDPVSLKPISASIPKKSKGGYKLFL